MQAGRSTEVYESLSGGDNASGRAHGVVDDDLALLVAQVVTLLAKGRTGLVTDIDGTISSIVARPEEAFVLPRAREALDGLKNVINTVAIVTGRGVEDARAMVGIEGAIYVGNHGLEVWQSHTHQVQLVAEARPWVPRLATVLDDVERQLPQSGIIVENKGATGSLHYRLAADPPLARVQLLEILARVAITSGLRVEEGRMVINILPPLMVTKGSAVTWLVREHDLDGIVYLGDDLTDTHAFRALGVLHQTDEVRTLGVGVVGPETAPSVRQLADACVPSVEAVAELLCRVLQGLRPHGLSEC